jgi:ADP-heptose:LPS heptosyltransferase
VQKILIVHNWGIGDWLFFTPVLRSLTAACPEAQIEVILGSPGTRPLVEMYPEVRIRAVVNVVENPWGLLWAGFKTWSCRYDALIFTAGLNSSKADKMAACIRARKKVALLTGPNRHFFLTSTSQFDRVRHQVENNLRILPLVGVKATQDTHPYLPTKGLPLPASGSVLIHPGCGRLQQVKRWPAARFAAVAEALLRQGRAVSVVLGPDEPELSENFAHLEGRPGFASYRGLPFREVISLISAHETLLNSDSGLGHLAAALGRRVVSIFGPADPRFSRPYGKNVQIIRTSVKLDCMPCWGIKYGCQEPLCLLNVETETVVTAMSNPIISQQNSERS